MKKLLIILAGLLLMSLNVFADDVSIDSSGNVKTGVSNTNAELEVTGASAEGAIRGMTSGTGASGVYGVNTSFGDYGVLGYYGYGVYGNSSGGWAGYFQGNARVTGNLTVDGTVSGPNIGDVTAVTAGTGLSGGATSGSAILNANTAYLQRRVSNSCTVGSSVRSINEDGTVLCETDDVGLTSESDPKVGSNTTDYVPKWNGSALVTGSIYDNGNIGIGIAFPETKLHVYRTEDDYGAGRSSVYGVRAGSNIETNGGTDWSLGGVDSAVKGYSYWGNQFTAGIAGYNDTDYANSAGVVGARQDGSFRGMLGYRDANSNYWAGYFDGPVYSSDKLIVSGTIESTSGGIKFPDGFVQTAASAPTWHQILPASERFVLVLNNNEAVLDKETGLVWERQPEGSTYVWKYAVLHCVHLTVGGRKGWHLPTVEQLSSLIDPTETGPSLPVGHPFIITNGAYWTITTVITTNNQYAWDLQIGNGLTYSDDKASSFNAWCVRGGQSHDGY